MPSPPAGGLFQEKTSGRVSSITSKRREKKIYNDISDMKFKILITGILLSFTVMAQKVVTTPMKIKYSCSQKYGLTPVEEDYNLIVNYTDQSITFKTRKEQQAAKYNVAKKTSKYIIGKNEDGNYMFYDINKKQLFYIDYFMSRYTTSGYGTDSADTKQKVLKMMEMLKSSKTQKDVIAYLVKQSEYDF